MTRGLVDTSAALRFLAEFRTSQIFFGRSTGISRPHVDESTLGRVDEHVLKYIVIRSIQSDSSAAHVPMNNKSMLVRTNPLVP